MADRSCRCLDEAETITGYRVKIWTREALDIIGYTLIVPPGSERQISAFWDAVIADGRLEKLIAASPERPWVLGLGSWDPACAKGGQRYTICIEETERTNLSELTKEQDFFRKRIGASDWMCFEMTHGRYLDQFWKDNAYKMMSKLGYAFNTGDGDFSIGLHFDAYPPCLRFPLDLNDRMEFWITVKKPTA